VKCGAALPDNATFCPNCGTAVSTGVPPQAAAVPPRWERRYDRYEKREKQEKNEKNEKGRGGDISGAITGALILIWLGISFYLAQSGRVGWENWWQIFLVGLGAVLILQGILRYARTRRPFIGPIIGGVVLMLIGLSFFAGANGVDFWPLILVAIGVIVLFSALAGRRRVPNP
jgi:MFS family permease